MPELTNTLKNSPSIRRENEGKKIASEPNPVVMQNKGRLCIRATFRANLLKTPKLIST